MDPRFKKFTFIFLLTVFVGVFGFWLSAHALDPVNLNVDNYPKIPVPEQFDQDGEPDGYFDLDCLRRGSCEFEQNELASFFLAFIYYTSIWVAGIIAFVSILYAGFLYVVSGQTPGNRAKAQERITAVVFGVLILFFAVLAFYTINPDIASLKITGQHAVEGGDAEMPTSDEITSIDNSSDIQNILLASADSYMEQCASSSSAKNECMDGCTTELDETGLIFKDDVRSVAMCEDAYVKYAGEGTPTAFTDAEYFNMGKACQDSTGYASSVVSSYFTRESPSLVSCDGQASPGGLDQDIWCGACGNNGGVVGECIAAYDQNTSTGLCQKVTY